MICHCFSRWHFETLKYFPTEKITKKKKHKKFHLKPHNFLKWMEKPHRNTSMVFITSWMKWKRINTEKKKPNIINLLAFYIYCSMPLNIPVCEQYCSNYNIKLHNYFSFSLQTFEIVCIIVYRFTFLINGNWDFFSMREMDLFMVKRFLWKTFRLFFFAIYKKKKAKRHFQNCIQFRMFDVTTSALKVKTGEKCYVGVFKWTGHTQTTQKIEE